MSRKKFGIKDKGGKLVPHKHNDENDEYNETSDRPKSIENIETIAVITENPTWVCIGGRWYKIG